MTRHHQQECADAVIHLDGNDYTNCIFRRCRLIYSGGSLPTLHLATFKECEWELAEQAGRVLVLLRALHSLGLQPADDAIEYIKGGQRRLISN
jgi:hypothetical protein